MAKKRIPLGPNFHAEPGETKGHQHDVYTTAGELHGLQRLHMGTLMKRAVEGLATALAEAEARGRRQGLEEAAKLTERWSLNRISREIRSLATTPAETRKPDA